MATTSNSRTSSGTSRAKGARKADPTANEAAARRHHVALTWLATHMQPVMQQLDVFEAETFGDRLDAEVRRASADVVATAKLFRRLAGGQPVELHTIGNDKLLPLVRRQQEFTPEDRQQLLAIAQREAHILAEIEKARIILPEKLCSAITGHQLMDTLDREREEYLRNARSSLGPAMARDEMPTHVDLRVSIKGQGGCFVGLRPWFKVEIREKDDDWLAMTQPSMESVLKSLDDYFRFEKVNMKLVSAVAEAWFVIEPGEFFIGPALTRLKRVAALAKDEHMPRKIVLVAPQMPAAVRDLVKHEGFKMVEIPPEVLAPVDASV